MLLPKYQCVVQLAGQSGQTDVFREVFAKTRNLGPTGARVARTRPGILRPVLIYLLTVLVSGPFAVWHILWDFLTDFHEGSYQDVDLSLCDNGSWCLGANETGRRCCQQGQGLFVVNGKVATVKPGTTANSPSVVTVTTTNTDTTKTPSSVVTTPVTSSPDSASPSSTSTGTNIGIGVGVGLGAVATMGFLGALLILRRRRGGRGARLWGTTQTSFQHSGKGDVSLATPRTTIHPTGDHENESFKFYSPTSLTFNHRESCLSYRALGLQDGPTELPVETSATRENPASV